MNPFNIFTNKNDLVKILSIGGLFVMIFSLIYPIEKKKELDLRKVELNSQIRILKGKNKEAQNFLTKIENDKCIDDNERGVYKSETKRLKSEMQNNKYSVSKLQDEIVVLKEYIEEYRIYTNLFFWTGLISSILGILFWTMSGIKEYRNKPSQ